MNSSKTFSVIAPGTLLVVAWALAHGTGCSNNGTSNAGSGSTSGSSGSSGSSGAAGTGATSGSGSSTGAMMGDSGTSGTDAGGGSGTATSCDAAANPLFSCPNGTCVPFDNSVIPANVPRL